MAVTSRPASQGSDHFNNSFALRSHFRRCSALGTGASWAARYFREYCDGQKRAPGNFNPGRQAPARTTAGFKYMGDSVLVCFGYLQAQEDDAERAVRAGLALIAAVAGLEKRASLQTRVRIATGLVVVGEFIGLRETQQRGIVGETPSRTRSSSPRAREDFSATSSRSRRSGQGTWSSFPSRFRHGRCCGQVPWKAVSRHCTRPAYPPSLDAKKNPNCCFSAGPRQRPVRVR
jgi:hypothetical protein